MSAHLSSSTGRRRLAAVLALSLACAPATPACGKTTNTGGAHAMNSVSLQFAEYRGDPGELAARVDRYLAAGGGEPLPADPVALVAPHAGYVYSGPVAAHAYRAVKGRDYDTVVVVGPSHRVPFQGISVLDASRFDTPLGSLTVDTALTSALIKASRGIRYLPEAHAQEHSVEVQIPFLQRALGTFGVVLAVVGGYSPEAEAAFVRELVKASKGRKILLVASSDLSHYHDYDTARKLDRVALGLVTSMDAQGLLRSAQREECEMCGLLPVHLAMEFARAAGANDARLLKAASSGDTAGPKDQVVGYAAVAFLPGKAKQAAAPPPAGKLGAKQQARLLEIARSTITDYVATGKAPEVREEDPALNTPSGAFVTIERHGNLRGCIGNFTSTEPLWKTVQKMAVAASTQDPRFTPMNTAETKDMELEISVLTPMRRISDPAEVQPGRHGLYIVKGYNAGTLLPQVATDYGWDRTTFLEQTCRKAGLPTDAWKEGAEIYVYEAEVFGEGKREP